MTITLDGTIGITTPTTNSTAEYVTSVTGFKNRIINGNMAIDQRNAGASVTPASTSNTFIVDRWSIYPSQASKLTAQQNAGSVTPPTGYNNYLGVTSSSAYAPLTSDIFILRQNIEGFNTNDLGWGTANAQSVTLSFKVYSNLTGTFGGAIGSANNSASYPFTYSIPVANTWTTISISIIGATIGSWATTNLSSLEVRLGLGCGTAVSGTAGSWSTTAYFSATGAVSVVGTSGATFYITGVQLEKGSTATSFDYRPYGTELALCQRYFELITSIGASGSSYVNFMAGAMNGVSQGTFSGNYIVPKRAIPTITYSALTDLCILYNGTGNATVLTAFAVFTSTTQILELQCSIGISITIYQAVYLGSYNNTTTAKINISAEL